MKLLEDVIKQKPILLNDWEESSIDDIYEQFIGETEEHNTFKAFSMFDDINILFASYGNQNFSGDAFVLFERNNVLYEVNAEHCSHFGLEGKWEEEETYLVSLKHRLEKGRFGTNDWAGNCFANELRDFLGMY